MKFKLNFRLPPGSKPVKRFFDGEAISYITIGNAPTKAEIRVKALHERQAFVIGQNIAKRNGWNLSGQPIKMAF